jgi:hypothetical protein
MVLLVIYGQKELLSYRMKFNTYDPLQFTENNRNCSVDFIPLPHSPFKTNAAQSLGGNPCLCNSSFAARNASAGSSPLAYRV